MKRQKHIFNVELRVGLERRHAAEILKLKRNAAPPIRCGMGLSSAVQFCNT
jgi:hypothetical protein